MSAPFKVLEGDALARLRELPDEAVHCVVTSPPYYGLRDYGVAGQLGLEETPEAYVARLVEAFREVRRVLRHDGTLWLNLGDSYGSNSPGVGSSASSTLTNPERQDRLWSGRKKERPAGTKVKDLIGIPWRVAFALQADGWWLRSDIIWAKPNPMPESVTDRPTKSHEYVFLLTKSASYFFDQTAVREPSGYYMRRDKRDPKNALRHERGYPGAPSRGAHPLGDVEKGRNLRSVWTITTKPFAGAHFAVFPPDLVEPCVLAGTSAHGACPACGAPWERITERVAVRKAGGPAQTSRKVVGAVDRVGQTSTFRTGTVPIRETRGWAPTCACGRADVAPCVVLDPFAGSGTTLVVALQHGRHALGIELNPTYAKMARQRIVEEAALGTSRRLEAYLQARGGPEALRALIQEGPHEVAHSSHATGDSGYRLDERSESSDARGGEPGGLDHQDAKVAVVGKVEQPGTVHEDCEDADHLGDADDHAGESIGPVKNPSSRGDDA